ncbi:MAG: rhodanese-like domain-containing protein [Psychroserpens sp.]|nr:rhodanese-like domain-containing protein [Psychroserpens sp.]
MKKLIYLFTACSLLFLSSCASEPNNEIKIVSPEEMQALLEMDDVQLVDVRTPEEHKSGFIKNSQNIDFTSPTFEQDIAKLDKNKPVILYCKAGGRSAKCSKKLKEAGFVKIYDLDGGITQWKFKGNPIESINN